MAIWMPRGEGKDVIQFIVMFLSKGGFNISLRQNGMVRRFFKLKKLSAKQINDSFTVIINPFGEVYSEEDRRVLTTFES